MSRYVATPIYPSASLFSRQGLSYVASSYLSLSNQYATIDRSATLNGRRYHLVSVHNAPTQSYVLTAIKITSYFIIIIPMLAMLTAYVTGRNDYHFDSSTYIENFSKFLSFEPENFRNHYEDATALVTLDPTILYRKNRYNESYLVSMFRNLNQLTLISKWISNGLIEKDPGHLLTKQDKSQLFAFASNPNVYDQSCYTGIVKHLNIITKGAIHKDLTQNCVDKIYTYNRDLWNYLTNASGTNPYPIDPNLSTPPTNSSHSYASSSGRSSSYYSSTHNTFNGSSHSRSNPSSSSYYNFFNNFPGFNSSYSSGPSSSSRRSPPPATSSSASLSYEDHLKTLYKLSGTTRTTDPINSKRDIKMLYNKAAVKQHPDKNTNTDTTELFRKVKESYENIKKTLEYQNLK